MNTAVDSTQAAEQATKPSVLFDRNKKFELNVPSADHESGRKTCIVRFPTDIEFCDRQRKLINVLKRTGDVSKNEQLNVETSANDLFDKILVSKPEGTEFESADALLIMSKLEKADLVEVTRVDGRTFAIELVVFGNKHVTHVLRIPSQKVIMEWGRATLVIRNRKQTTETIIALEPAAAVYGKCFISHEGYAGEDKSALPVPIVHIAAAVNALINSVNEDSDSPDPEV